MSRMDLLCGGLLLLLNITFAAQACAEPGDIASVAQARKEYRDAMKGHDQGLQNAMRAQLAAQLAMAREKSTPRNKARAQVTALNAPEKVRVQ